MKKLNIGTKLVLGVLITSAAIGCSASTEEKTGPGNGGAVGAGGAGGLPQAGGTAGAGGAGAGGIGTGNNGSLGGLPEIPDDPITGGADGAGGAGQDCKFGDKPEEVIQYSPVALFIMQDRSGSMVTGFPPPASADGWNNSTAAVTAFVNDPASNGLSVGLGSFPPMQGNVDCAAGSDCGTPIVPIAALPGNAQPMITGMQNATPNNPVALTPTECGLRGMVTTCAAHKTATNVQCVAVLVTDGTPTQCDGNAANLDAIVAAGAAQGVKTFVIGLPGSNLQALNELATAGGTNAAIDVSGGPAAFIAALNTIRSQISIGTKLNCQWNIPAPPKGQEFDPSLVNVRFSPKGAPPRDFGKVVVAQCDQATDAWYFDDEANPKKILVCPKTCEMLTASSGSGIDVSFGCKQIPGKIE